MSDLLFSPQEHLEAARLLADFTARYHESLAARPVHPEIDRPAARPDSRGSGR